MGCLIIAHKAKRILCKYFPENFTLQREVVLHLVNTVLQKNIRISDVLDLTEVQNKGTDIHLFVIIFVH